MSQPTEQLKPDQGIRTRHTAGAAAQQASTSNQRSSKALNAVNTVVSTEKVASAAMSNQESSADQRQQATNHGANGSLGGSGKNLNFLLSFQRFYLLFLRLMI